MEVVTMEPESLRKLVRRDVVVVAAGTLIAIWTYSLVAAVTSGRCPSSRRGAPRWPWR